MSNFSVEIIGIDNLTKSLALYGQKAINGLKSALFQEAEAIMGRSKRDFVPVQTGALRASGHVTKPEETSFGYKVTLGFGGPSAPYALKVHEDLRAFHPHGTSKYLETPLLEAEKGMTGRIAAHISKAVK